MRCARNSALTKIPLLRPIVSNWRIVSKQGAGVGVGRGGRGCSILGMGGGDVACLGMGWDEGCSILGKGAYLGWGRGCSI